MDEEAKWYRKLITPAIAAIGFTFIMHVQYINIIIQNTTPPTSEGLESIHTK